MRYVEIYNDNAEVFAYDGNAEVLEHNLGNAYYYDKVYCEGIFADDDDIAHPNRSFPPKVMLDLLQQCPVMDIMLSNVASNLS